MTIFLYEGSYMLYINGQDFNIEQIKRRNQREKTSVLKVIVLYELHT